MQETFMARGITENDVWKACDALLLAGERPTIERVRQHIGRGSPNTVSPFLDTWFRGLGGRIKDPGAFAAPPDIPDPIQQAAKHFWEVALAQTRLDFDERLRSAMADATTSLRAAQGAAEAAKLEADRWRTAADEFRTGIEARVQECESERLAHATTRALLEAQARRNDNLEGRLAALMEELEEVRQATAAQVQAAHERADGAERRAALEIEAARSERNKAAKRAEQLETRLDELNTDHQRQSTAAAQIAAKLEAELAAERASAQMSHKQAADARQLAESLTERLSEAHSRHAALEARAATAEDFMRRLESMNPGGLAPKRAKGRTSSASG